jgi:AcrR family transcriptional regulator
MVVKGNRVERGEITREALVGAARLLFGRDGFTSTSLDDIASAAGVTKGALYHHFQNKEELFRAVAESVKRDINTRLSDLFIGSDAFTALEAGCFTILEAYLDPSVRQIVWADAPAVLSLSAYRDIQGRYEQVFLRASLRRAMREGVIESLPLRPLTALLTGAIGEGCTFIAASPDPIVAREEVGHTMSRLLGGLRRHPLD